MYQVLSKPKGMLDFMATGGVTIQQREEFDIFSSEQIHLCAHFFSIIQKTKSKAHDESVDDYCLFIKDMVDHSKFSAQKKNHWIERSEGK